MARLSSRRISFLVRPLVAYRYPTHVTLTSCSRAQRRRGNPFSSHSRRRTHAVGPYLPIAEHGLIGDLHTAALVGTDGTIDWYC